MKTAKVVSYEMYGTHGEYCVQIEYRGKVLKQFCGQSNRAELVSKACCYAINGLKFSAVKLTKE